MYLKKERKNQMKDKILLACSAGMSTSLIVQKMKKIAAEQNKNYVIWATAVDDIVDDEKSFDCCLIGPQVSGRVKDVEEAVAEYGDNIPVAIIDKDDYGKMRADKILALAERLLK